VLLLLWRGTVKSLGENVGFDLVDLEIMAELKR